MILYEIIYFTTAEVVLDIGFIFYTHSSVKDKEKMSWIKTSSVCTDIAVIGIYDTKKIKNKKMEEFNEKNKVILKSYNSKDKRSFYPGKYGAFIETRSDGCFKVLTSKNSKNKIVGIALTFYGDKSDFGAIFGCNLIKC